MAIYSLPTYESYEVDMLLDESYDMLYELENERYLYESDYITESGIFRAIADKIKEIWDKIVETVKKWAEKVKKFFGFDSDEAEAADDVKNKAEKAANEGKTNADNAAKTGDDEALGKEKEKAESFNKEVKRKLKNGFGINGKLYKHKRIYVNNEKDNINKGMGMDDYTLYFDAKSGPFFDKLDKELKYTSSTRRR